MVSEPSFWLIFWLHSSPEGANVARPVVRSLDLRCPSENTCDGAMFVVRLCFSLLCLLHWMIALCKHALVCQHVPCVHDGPPSVSLSGLPQNLVLGYICHASRVDTARDGRRKDNASSSATTFSMSLHPAHRAFEDDSEPFISHRSAEVERCGCISQELGGLGHNVLHHHPSRQETW